MNLSELKEKTKQLFGKNKKLTAQAFEGYTDAIGSLDTIQDTGWVNFPVSDSAINGTIVRARRIGNTVIVDVSGARFDTVAVKDSGWWKQKDPWGQDYYATFIVPVQGIPKGFRSSKTIMGSIYTDGPEFAGTWQLSSSVNNYLALKIKNKSPGDVAGIRLSQVKYFTDDPFPKIENGKVVN